VVKVAPGLAFILMGIMGRAFGSITRISGMNVWRFAQSLGYDTGLLILVISAIISANGNFVLCSFWSISGLSFWMMGIILFMTSPVDDE